MSLHVCLYANTVTYPEAGGQFWVYLNWALGLRAVGAEVTWLEDVGELPRDLRAPAAARLASRVAGQAAGIAVAVTDGRSGLDFAAGCDLLLNLNYDCRPAVLERFARTALVDIDPGLTQTWMTLGELEIGGHDRYFTIGETVGRPGSRIPTGGLDWQYTPPAVHLPSWPVRPAGPRAPYTTVTHWWDHDDIIDGREIDNSKRLTFLACAELPQRVRAGFELALDDIDEDGDRRVLERRGWRVRRAAAVSRTADVYRAYVQRSRGEFSCAKPSCMLLQNAWISDRTLCYLASGKPAIVQHTGPSRLLPDAEGLLRFTDLDGAVAAVRAVEADYGHHAAAARALAERHFDAAKVVRHLLERAL
jgi:hypothetical protein